MSATLKVDDFSKNQKLFLQPPPIIEVNILKIYKLFDIHFKFNYFEMLL